MIEYIQELYYITSLNVIPFAIICKWNNLFIRNNIFALFFVFTKRKVLLMRTELFVRRMVKML